MEVAVIVSGFIGAALLCGAVKNNKRFYSIVSILASLTALVSSASIAYKVAKHGTYSPFSFVSVDALSALIMLTISIVAFFASIYAVPYLRAEVRKKLINTRVREYHILANLFLASTFLAAVASHPVAAWIFLEATTLTTVFLVSFYNRSSTIEAAWKYLIINAIGLLLAFFGTLLFLAHGEGLNSWQALIDSASSLDPNLVRLAFVFVLIGYGTKIGLAPMHTWKPDAYSKAPMPLGALFSGALMPVAFLVLLKFKAVTDAVLGPAFSQHLLIAFGTISMLVAAFSALTIRNYKRLLAFSSIENAGMVCLGLGFGGIGILAAVLQLIYHSFLKSALFFLAGNIMIKYHSSHIEKVRGAMSAIPFTVVMFFVGLFAVTGFPPFGIFFTELFTLSAGVKAYLAISVVALIAIAILFIGFLRQTGLMVFGEKPEEVSSGEGTAWLLVPPAVLLSLTLVISFYMPPFVETLIKQAVAGL